MSRETEPLFVFRKSWSSAGIFASDAVKRHVEMGVVEAESLDDAQKAILGRSNVLSLEERVTLEIQPLDFTGAHTVYAQYDGEAFDDVHRPTGAKLEVGPLL